MEEISIKEYLDIIIKHRLLIIIVTIIATLSSFVVSKFFLKPVYSAQATLIVGNTKMEQKDNVDVNALMFYDKLVSTYAKVITSDNILSDVSKKVGFKTNSGELLKNITVEPQQDTQLINVTARNHDPLKAQTIANQICKSFVKKIAVIMKMEQNVNILDNAARPKSPESPKVLLNTVIALFVGLMLSVFIAFLIEYLDDTIKTPDDIEKHIGLAVIGTIPMVNDELLSDGGDKK